MNRSLRNTLLATLACGLAASAHAQLSAEDMIKFRQSAYTVMSWNMGTIKGQVEGESYDQARVAAAANSIAAIANSGMGALYAPGTDQGKGWKETRLKSEFFTEQDKVREVGTNFVQQANKLQEVAMNGDKAAVATQFGEVGKACKACHDNFRTEE